MRSRPWSLRNGEPLARFEPFMTVTATKRPLGEIAIPFRRHAYGQLIDRARRIGSEIDHGHRVGPARRARADVGDEQRAPVRRDLDADGLKLRGQIALQY